MAKTSFKVPVSLDRSFLDHEINLSSGGWQVPPTPMKVVLFYLVGLLGLFWAVTGTFIKSASLPLIVGFVVFWLIAVLFLAKYNKNKEMNISKVPAFVGYAPPKARRVVTRSKSNPSDFYSIARINSIDESGLIHLQDGTIAQCYLVVGSGSILVFEEDKKTILDRVDAFFRKIDTSVELAFITTKEPQRIYKQLAHLDDINLRLENRHPELIELMRERFDILNEFVGDSFTSIHQYLMIKGDNLEALRRAHTVVAAEAEDSSLMFKQVTMMDQVDAYEMLKVFYTGVEVEARG